MRKLLYSFVLGVSLFLGSCGQSINESDLHLLNGYWEIEKVRMSDGEIKDYTINTSLDYFEVDDQGVGFRQKVMPQLNGEYETNEVQEQVSIKKEGNTFWMEYSTEFANWKEQLMSLEKGKLVVKNTHDITYYYKQAIPFSEK